MLSAWAAGSSTGAAELPGANPATATATAARPANDVTILRMGVPSAGRGGARSANPTSGHHTITVSTQAQNRIVAKVSTVRKPTRSYAARAGVLKALTYSVTTGVICRASSTTAAIPG